jgi:hypothetical protein
MESTKDNSPFFIFYDKRTWSSNTPLDTGAAYIAAQVKGSPLKCESTSNIDPLIIYNPLLFLQGWVKKGADPVSMSEADPHWTQKSKLEEGFQLAFLV